MTDILRIKDLKVEFVLPHMRVKAVENVSFRIGAQETVALVGESGSGKSTISQAIMGLLPRVAEVTNGSIIFADPKSRVRASILPCWIVPARKCVLSAAVGSR